MTEQIIHPLTGVVLDDDELEPGQLIAAVQATDAIISRHYEKARQLREANDRVKRWLADRGEYELPRKSARTKTQDRVAACPRCGDKPEAEAA